MPDRKSSRSRKQVDYSKFADGDIDDDFADSTPPVSKKQKLSNKENKEKKRDKQTVKVQSKAKDRRSVEERLYERELQAALELSMSQSDASQEPEPPSLSINQSDASQEPEPLPVLTDSSIGPTPTPASAIPVLEKVDEICVIPDDVAPPSPIVPTAETVTVSTNNSRRGNDPDDAIEILEPVPSTSRQRNPRPKKYIDSDSDDNDSDFAVADESPSDDDSDDDYCEDDDSDFDGGGKKKGKRTSTSTPKPAVKKTTKENKKNTTKSQKTAKTEKSSNQKAVPIKSTAGVTAKSSPGVNVLKKSTVTGVPARSSPLTAVRNVPSWTPPGRSGTDSPTIKSRQVNIKSPSVGVSVKSPCDGVNIKSPTSGLRLGLSRNMKLKPLHPNLKIQN